MLDNKKKTGGNGFIDFNALNFLTNNTFLNTSGIISSSRLCAVLTTT